MYGRKALIPAPFAVLNMSERNLLACPIGHREWISTYLYGEKERVLKNGLKEENSYNINKAIKFRFSIF
jgi:hypothetical protein